MVIGAFCEGRRVPGAAVLWTRPSPNEPKGFTWLLSSIPSPSMGGCLRCRAKGERCCNAARRCLRVDERHREICERSRSYNLLGPISNTAHLGDDCGHVLLGDARIALKHREELAMPDHVLVSMWPPCEVQELDAGRPPHCQAERGAGQPLLGLSEEHGAVGAEGRLLVAKRVG